MTCSAGAFIPISVMLLFAANAGFSIPVQSSTSVTRQFIVFGGEAASRGEVCELAEQLKTKLLRTLNISDQWAIPVLVNLQPAQSNLPELPPSLIYFSQTGAGLKIQLNLLLTEDPAPAPIARELIRAVLLEMSYRAKQDLPAGTPFILPRDWLVDGLLMMDTAPPLAAVAGTTSKPLELRSLLGQNAALLDSPSRQVYLACATSLVKVLLKQENGCDRLVRYIADLPGASADAITDLCAHFPSFGEDPKTWERNVADCVDRLAAGQDGGPLSFEATSAEINSCLNSRIASDGKNSFSMSDAGTISARTVDLKAAKAVARRLALLSTRAHPALRSVVSEYQQVAESITDRRDKGVANRLSDAGRMKARIGARMQRIEDLLNWFEATQAQHSSGTFTDYIRAAQQLDKSSRRRDPVSVYLDSMETQFQ